MTRSERLRPVEAIMWRAGQDTRLRATVSSLIVLDRVPAREAILERLTSVIEDALRLRWRLDDRARRGAGRPSWIDDGRFDPSAHVRTMAVPAPGDARVVLDLMELLEHQAFNPDHSPWDVTIIEGMAGGRGAVYVRADHALTDGLGGVTIMDLLFDRPGAAAPKPAPEDEPVAVEAKPDDAAPADEAAPAVARRAPGTLTVTLDLTKAAKPVAAGVTAGVHAVRQGAPFDAVVRRLQRGVDLVNSVSRQLVVTGGRLSPLPVRHPTTSRFEIIAVPDARHTSLALGGSRNDLLVTAVATALGEYHTKRGMTAAELRLAMPAGRRRERGATGNSFSLSRVEVPTDGTYPAPHFGVISDRLARARIEPAIKYTDTLAAAASWLPARVFLPALQSQVDSIDFVATALPGFRRPPRFCGAVVEGIYPFGPRMGCLMNVAAFGNEGRLDVGIAVDPIAIDEPALFMECLVGAFGRLAAAAEASEAPPRDGGQQQ